VTAKVERVDGIAARKQCQQLFVKAPRGTHSIAVREHERPLARSGPDAAVSKLRAIYRNVLNLDHHPVVFSKRKQKGFDA
jgi:hypothetical protein